MSTQEFEQVYSSDNWQTDENLLNILSVISLGLRFSISLNIVRRSMVRKIQLWLSCISEQAEKVHEKWRFYCI